jgi:hypothetical protein
MWFLDLPLFGWLVLAGLGYCLVTAVLYFAARWLDQHQQRHDLAVRAQKRSLAKQEAAREEQASHATG